MKIEAGKYYRTRDGRKVGPMELRDASSDHIVLCAGWPGDWYGDNGRRGSGPERNDDLIAEWTDEPAAPKTWGEMTDAEKGALLLAHHDGKVIEYWSPSLYKDWTTPTERFGPCWADDVMYRVRPPEPVRETVTKHIRRYGEGWLMSTERLGSNNHRITFDTIDGKPDCDTIRMERINDKP